MESRPESARGARECEVFSVVGSTRVPRVPVRRPAEQIERMVATPIVRSRTKAIGETPMAATETVAIPFNELRLRQIVLQHFDRVGWQARIDLERHIRFAEIILLHTNASALLSHDVQKRRRSIQRF